MVLLECLLMVLLPLSFVKLLQINGSSSNERFCFHNRILYRFPWFSVGILAQSASALLRFFYLIVLFHHQVTRHKCQYKYAGGSKFVMVSKILQVKEVGRLMTEEYLKRQWKKSPDEAAS